LPKTKKARLGQNFLADRHAANNIVDALGDISDRLVVEIGPGKAHSRKSLPSELEG
jgi:16S rRNA (adenine1518-N6/adenine1519-N6)-dimethyltransferase